MKMKVLIASDSGTPWTVALPASLSMQFSSQEYWSGQSSPSPEDLPDPGIELRSPAWQADALLTELPGKSQREGTYVYLGLTHTAVQQKPTQH